MKTNKCALYYTINATIRQTLTFKMREHICAAHRSVNVHRIHISKAGSNLHPVFMDPQNVIFLKVQR